LRTAFNPFSLELEAEANSKKLAACG